MEITPTGMAKTIMMDNAIIPALGRLRKRIVSLRSAWAAK
jgi:hypothetical protein